MSDQSRPPVIGYPAAAYPQHPPPGADPVSHYKTYPTADTSYPYDAPPPHGSLNNTNPHNADPGAALRTPFQRNLFDVLMVTIMTAAVIFIIFSVLHQPKRPEFRVDSVTLSNFNVSNDSTVTGNWDVRFTVRNPNGRVSLSYSDIVAGISYRSETLTNTAVPPFVQGEKNETAVRATLAASSTYLAPRYVEEMKSNRGGGSVSFNVEMVGTVRVKGGRWPKWEKYFKLYCGDLQVGVSDNSSGGSLLGGARECRLDYD